MGGVVQYGFTALFEPIVQEFGWSYASVSLAASLRGLETGLLAPVTGFLADRWGPRRLVMIGSLLTAVGLLLLSLTQSLTMFYGAFVVVALGVSCCTVTVLMTAVSNWFHRKVGTASGIALSGFGLSGLVLPLLVALIASFGWRSALQLLSIGAIVVVLPMSLLLRHKPEQYGLAPDGDAGTVVPVTTPERGSIPDATAEPRFTVRQAMGTRTFWAIAAVFTYHTLTVSTITTHVMPYLSSVGFDRAAAAAVATFVPLLSVLGRVGLGWLSDRVDRRKSTVVSHAMMGVGTLCFALIPQGGAWLVLPYVLLFGIGFGGSNSLRPALVREFFGRASFGTVFGLVIGVNMIGSIAGPPVAGWVFDTFGDYEFAWLALTGLSVASIALIFTIHPAQGRGSMSIRL